MKSALQKFGLDPGQVEKVLRHALRRGGDLSELFFERTAATRIVYEGGRVDRVTDGTDRGVGLRILFEGRSVYGYTTDLSETALMALAETLGAAVVSKKPAREWPSAMEWRMARQPCEPIVGHGIQRSARKTPLKDKIALAVRADQAVRAELKDPRQVSVGVLDSEREILLCNSDGTVAPDEKSLVQMVVHVVAEKNGRVESAHASEGGFVGMEFFDEVTPESLAAKVAQRVIVLLDAKPAPAGTMPVVMAAEAGGTMIHEAVGHGLEADLAGNGLSVYQGKLGQQVASPLISVVDDGSMPGKRGSFRFDDEGNPSRKNVLIENGILKSYMVDRLSAMKFDMMATGNGRRESFRHKPLVRMTNTYIAPGKDDPAEILASTPYGLFVRGMGGGQVNSVTGDFVFAVTEGYLIRDGKIADPIRGATLVGNGPKVLSQIDRVGSDLGFSTTGTCGKDGQGAQVTDAQPTVRIPALTVGGEVPLSSYWSEKVILQGLR